VFAAGGEREIRGELRDVGRRDVQRAILDPGEQDERIPEVTPDAAAGGTDGCQASEISIIEERKVRFAPVERGFYSWSPCAGEPNL
jgi:hypothetical protein